MLGMLTMLLLMMMMMMMMIMPVVVVAQLTLLQAQDQLIADLVRLVSTAHSDLAPALLGLPGPPAARPIARATAILPPGFWPARG